MKSRFLKVFIIFLSVLFLMSCDFDDTNSELPKKDYARSVSSEDFIFITTFDNLKVDEKYNTYTAYLVQCNLSTNVIPANQLGWALNVSDYNKLYSQNRSLISYNSFQNALPANVQMTKSFNESKITYIDYDEHTFPKVKLTSENKNARTALFSSNSTSISYSSALTFRSKDEINYRSIKATKKKEGTYCVVYLDEKDDKKGANVTNEVINEIVKKFDSIFEKEIEIFGTAVIAARDENGNRYSNLLYTTSSDKITILLYDINNDKQTPYGTYGYFSGNDLYTSENITYQGGGESATYTNKRPMFYIDTYFLMNGETRNASYSTLAHEFQHLLNYINKWINHQASSDIWFNEMLSMLAEEIFQDALDITDDDSPKYRLANFNFSPHYGFSDYTWDEAKKTNASGSYEYANSYAFGTYLAHNYGGIRLVKEISKNKYVNEEAITKALKTLGYNETFETVFFKFAKVMLNTDEVTDETISLNKTADEYFKNIDLKNYKYEAGLVQQNYVAALLNGKIEGFNCVATGPAIFKDAHTIELFPYSMEIMKIGKVEEQFMCQLPTNSDVFMFVALKK